MQAELRAGARGPFGLLSPERGEYPPEALGGPEAPQAQREVPRPSSLHPPHLPATSVGRSHAESQFTSRAWALWVSVLCPRPGSRHQAPNPETPVSPQAPKNCPAKGQWPGRVLSGAPPGRVHLTQGHPFRTSGVEGWGPLWPAGSHHGAADLAMSGKEEVCLLPRVWGCRTRRWPQAALTQTGPGRRAGSVAGQPGADPLCPSLSTAQPPAPGPEHDSAISQTGQAGAGSTLWALSSGACVTPRAWLGAPSRRPGPGDPDVQCGVATARTVDTGGRGHVSVRRPGWGTSPWAGRLSRCPCPTHF